MQLITALTYVLPHRFVSSLARKLAYSTNPRTKQWLIDTVVRKFDVNLSEAMEPDASRYPSFNAFFTRALRPGARVPDPDPRVLTMPADGRISECGHIGFAGDAEHDDPGHIFQAKGHGFSTAQLLGDAQKAKAYVGGTFATVYLSPRDYHRVHMPWSGTLVETVHVPGRLFSVGVDAVGSVSRLFARNERLVCHFETDFGPMTLVMVGALLVSGVETVWSGVEIPPYGGPVVRKDWRGNGVALERFAEMARFNYGSTVIVLLPTGVAELAPGLRAQAPVQLGEKFATLL
jgi:phosphatidylserine decarboxylase